MPQGLTGLVVRGCNNLEGEGAVVIASNITVRNCTFDSNIMFQGGAIRIGSGSPMFQSVVFSNNLAEVGGGAVYIRGGAPLFAECLFQSNEVLFGKGGAVNIRAGTPQFEDCVFRSNKALFAGAIHTKTDSTESLFGPKVSVSRTNFTSNIADEGGAIGLSRGDLVIIDCQFDQNSAFNRGGALNVLGGALQFQRVTFRSNKAGTGGGIAIDDATITCSECKFISNKALDNGRGGGVSVSGDRTVAIMDGAVFSQNSGGTGGAVVVILGKTSCQKCNFVENFAQSVGGSSAIAVGGPSSLGWAGAVYVEGGDAYMSESNFSHNKATAGGGGLVVRGGKVTCTSCRFSRNVLSEAGANGAAVSMWGGLANLTGSKLLYNQAVGSGGATFTYGDATTR